MKLYSLLILSLIMINFLAQSMQHLNQNSNSVRTEVIQSSVAPSLQSLISPSVQLIRETNVLNVPSSKMVATALEQADLDCIKKFPSDFTLIKDLKALNDIYQATFDFAFNNDCEEYLPNLPTRRIYNTLVLYKAIKNNDTRLVNLLLNTINETKEIDLKFKDNSGQTMLNRALSNGNEEIAASLLKLAILTKNEEMVRVWFEENREQLKKDLTESFPHCKIEKHHLEKMVLWVIEHGAIDALDTNAKSLLDYAIEECNDALLYFLIKNGFQNQMHIFNRVFQSKEKISFLQNAVEECNTSFRKYADLDCIKKLSAQLISKDRDNADTTSGSESNCDILVLHKALKNDHTLLARLLINEMGSIEPLEGDYSNQQRFRSILSDNENILKILLEIAVLDKNEEMIRLWFENRAEEFENNKFDRHGLKKVEKHHLEKVIWWMIQYGDINIRDCNGKSVLDYAAQENNAKLSRQGNRIVNEMLLKFLEKQGFQMYGHTSRESIPSSAKAIEKIEEHNYVLLDFLIKALLELTSWSSQNSFLPIKTILSIESLKKAPESIYLGQLLNGNTGDLQAANNTLLNRALEQNNPYLISFLIKRGSLFKTYTQTEIAKFLSKAIDLLCPWLVREIAALKCLAERSGAYLNPIKKVIEKSKLPLNQKDKETLKDITLSLRDYWDANFVYLEEAPSYVTQQILSELASCDMSDISNSSGCFVFNSIQSHLERLKKNAEYTLDSSVKPGLKEPSQQIIERYFEDHELAVIRSSTIKKIHYLANLPENSSTINEIMDLIKQKQVDIDVLAYGKKSPLYIALFNKNKEIAFRLIKHGADVTIQTDEGISPLDLIYMHNYADIAKWLSENKDIRPSIDRTVPEVGKLFYWAAEHGYTQLIEIMLNRTTISHYDTILPADLVYGINYHGLTQQAINDRSYQRDDDNGGSTTYNKDAKQVILKKRHTTALHLAACNYHEPIVTLLLSNDIPYVDPVNERGMTPLHCLMQKRILDEEEKQKALTVARLLIDKGANIDAQDDRKITPLHYAVKSSCLLRAAFMLDAGANSNVQDEYGDTPLHSLMKRGIVSALSKKQLEEVLSVARLLIHKGANINAQNDEKKTPLHYAVESGCLLKIALMLENNADVTIQDQYGHTPLYYVVNKEIDSKEKTEKNLSIARLLISKGGSIDVQDKQGSTLLHWATQNNYRALAQLLIEKGTSANIQDFTHCTPLHYFIKNVPLILRSKAIDVREVFSIATLLISKEANINAQDVEKKTCLHYAVESGCVLSVNFMIKAGADVNIQDKNGCTPLHLALSLKNSEMVDMLLKVHPNLSLKDERGFTALDVACQLSKDITNGLVAITNKITHKLEKDKSWALRVEDEEKQLKLLLKEASQLPNKNIINRLLLEENNEPTSVQMVYELFESFKVSIKQTLDLLKYLSNVRLDEEKKRLHTAAEHNSASEIEYLIEDGADINSQDERGCTPLHVAISCKSVRVFQMLLKASQNLNFTIKDQSGCTPLELAYQLVKDKLPVLLQAKSKFADMLKENGRVTIQDMNNLKSSLGNCYLSNFIMKSLLLDKNFPKEKIERAFFDLVNQLYKEAETSVKEARALLDSVTVDKIAD